MKEGFTLKGARAEQGELDTIARFARRKVNAEDIYVFSVVLCDNEIDREGERFSRSALQRLSELFVGKTGIFDHSMKGKDQTARIFSAHVETDEGRQNSCGEPYCRLVARAYMPRLPKHAELIEEIELGIKKEVSVGCAVGKMSCSVCGADPRQGGCGHQKGRTYSVNGQHVICHTLLEEPKDAYEWSFVAVPAQPLAGVTKAYSIQKEEPKLEEIREQIRRHGEVILHAETSKALDQYIERLEQEAALGRAYRKSLRQEIVRLSALAEPALDNGFMRSLTEKMSVEEMETFKSYYESRVRTALPVKPQLTMESRSRSGQEYSDFRI